MFFLVQITKTMRCKDLRKDFGRIIDDAIDLTGDNVIIEFAVSLCKKIRQKEQLPREIFWKILVLISDFQTNLLRIISGSKDTDDDRF